MTLTALLDQLESAQLVRRLDEPELTFIFKHALTQDAAYQSLLQKRRRAIHGEVVRAYERSFADHVPDEYAAVLALHCAEAGDDEKTLEYSARAGDAAARVYSNAEAITNFSRALHVAKRLRADDQSLWQRLYLKLGRALELSHRYSDALANYDEMEAQARGLGDPMLELQGLIARATLFSTHTAVHDAAKAETASAQALELTRRIGDRKSEAKILWTQMLFNIYSTGDGHAAVALGEQSLARLRELSPSPQFARDLSVREQLAYTLNDLLYAYLEIGQLESGLAALLEAQELWRELENKPMLADNLAGVALAQLAVGDAEQAVATAEECFAIAQSVENEWGMARGELMRGSALIELGRVAEGLASLHAADRYATSGETGGAMVAARCALAAEYGALGMFARGLQHGERALEAARKYVAGWDSWPQAILVRLYLARGDLETAQGIAKEIGLESPEAKSFKAFPSYAATVILAQAELALAKKNYARVVEIADANFEFIDGSTRNRLPDLLLRRAEALIAQGELDQAASTLHQARAAAKTSRRISWSVLGALSTLESARGDSVAAQAWRDQALEQVKIIADHLAEDARESFYSLPAVSAILTGA